MNTKNLILTALALVAMAISCKKDPEKEKGPAPVDYGNFKFTSTFTQLDSKTEWVKGEEIAIFWLDKKNKEHHTVASASDNGATVDFIASIDTASRYYAVYPASAQLSMTGERRFSMTVPASQGGYLARTGVSIASATEKEASFTFAPVLPLLKFTVDRDDVTSVFIRGMHSEALTGTLEFTLSEEGAISFAAAGETSDEIEVSVDGAGTYYAAVLPNIQLSDGLLVRYSKSGTYLPASVVAVENALTSGTIKNLGTIKAVTDYTIATQADASIVRDMLGTEPTLTEEGYVYDQNDVIVKGWRCNGVTFHLGDGVFDLLAGSEVAGDVIDMEYWYYGDRYKSPVIVSIVGNGSDKTVITGACDTDKTKGHGVFKVQDYGQLILKDIAFKDTYRPGVNPKGGAIMISSKTECTVNVENCLFENNNVPEDGGGAIGMVDGGVLVAKNCVFKSNSAKFGGCLYGTGESNLTIEGCTFESNKGSGTNGPSVAVFWGNAYAKFNKCIFKDNRAVDRAVLNAQGTSVLFVNGCTFEANANTAAGKYASAIHAGNDFTAINNCTFWQNNVKDGSAPQNNSECISANASMIVSNCTFYEYFQANRGVFAGLKADKEAFLFNSIVLNSYSTCAFYFTSAGYKVVSYGHNIYRNVTDYRKDAAKIGIPAATGDIPSVAANILDGASYDAVDHVYKWSGNLTSGEIVPAAKADFEACIKAFQTELSNKALSGKKAGDAFWAWLEEIKATDTDQLGASRGQSWWPGSWQFN